jgi:hypothetical protein
VLPSPSPGERGAEPIGVSERDTRSVVPQDDFPLLHSVKDPVRSPVQRRLSPIPRQCGPKHKRPPHLNGGGRCVMMFATLAAPTALTAAPVYVKNEKSFRLFHIVAQPRLIVRTFSTIQPHTVDEPNRKSQTIKIMVRLFSHTQGICRQSRS